MAIPFGHNIDLMTNRLINAGLQVEPQHPLNPFAGQVYYNSTDGRFYGYDGKESQWTALDAADAAMTGASIINAINYENTAKINLARINVSTFGKDNDGLVPKVDAVLGTTKYLREDGTWVVPPDTNDTYNVFDHQNDGLVPKGVQISAGKFLRDDGGWETPTYSTKASLGLDNVTNDAQVKAVPTGTTQGYIPTWGVTGADLQVGYEVSTDLTAALGETAKLVTAQAAKGYADSILGANDAMVYKGTLAGGDNYPPADAGHTYKITAAGKIGGSNGPTVEIGDMLICLVDSSLGGTFEAVGAQWNIIQANIDGAVIGPASSVTNNFVAFNGSTGKLIKDSGFSNASFAASVHDHIGVHTRKYSAPLAAQATQTITHNLNTEDVTVTIRETSGTSKQIIYTDVKITGVNTIEVAFATAPGANEYTVVIIG